jgi:hypothetical protein
VWRALQPAASATKSDGEPFKLNILNWSTRKKGKSLLVRVFPFFLLLLFIQCSLWSMKETVKSGNQTDQFIKFMFLQEVQMVPFFRVEDWMYIFRAHF